MSDGYAFSLQAKVERLEARNAELREALEDISDAAGRINPDTTHRLWRAIADANRVLSSARGES